MRPFRVKIVLLHHKKWVFTGLAALLGLVICVACVSARSIPTAATLRELPIYCVQKETPICALSFDAAWGNEDTQQLIEIFDKYQLKTTFFVVGEWVDKYPESVQALHDAGHEVMNHSDNHPYFTKLSAQQMQEQLSACNEKIAAITGETPLLFRPPYGDYNDTVIRTVRDCGMYAIQWDVDSLDWKDPTPEEICQRVLKRVQPGSIILFHNAAKNTPAALPSVIEGLIRQGYEIVPVSQLIYREDFTMDHTGRQIPN